MGAHVRASEDLPSFAALNMASGEVLHEFASFAVSRELEAKGSVWGLAETGQLLHLLGEAKYRVWDDVFHDELA